MTKHDFTNKLLLPKVIFGTSGLGNLYTALDDQVKLDIVNECVTHADKLVVFDSAGKYGAGLALESLGKSLRQLNVLPKDMIISNKLGWLRTELKTSEPTFEPGVWCGLKHDAVQRISYHGILECYEQGNKLLNGYDATFLSVHDPDEYLAGAQSEKEKEQRFEDILNAYLALGELKSKGKIKAIGVGSKDWKIIKRITETIQLDWVMIANSMTLHSHPADLLNYMAELEKIGVAIINSAVFNGGFLVGSDFYNYKMVDPTAGKALYQWRDDFFKLCMRYAIEPAQACVAFGLSAPGVKSIALNTTSAKKVQKNIEMANTIIPKEFWQEMKNHGLIDHSYTYL